MGFIDIIIRIFMGSDYDKKIRNLDSRIFELRKYIRNADFVLDKLKKVSIDIPSFDIHRFSDIHAKEEISSFVPPKTIKNRTMKDLMNKRKEEEAQRKKRLKQQINKNLNTVSFFITNEDVDSAEDLLFGTSSSIQELQDTQLIEFYERLRIKINELREELRQREIKRLEEEERRKAREEAERLERERQRRAREEIQRLEKERKAREYEEKLAKEEEKLRLEINRLTSLVTREKNDAESILRYLRMKGVTKFYHFTAKENLYQIKKLGGLYSWFYCVNNGINIPNPGGDSSSRGYDRYHDLQDYVRLSFCDDHPMAYRKHQEGSSLVLLYIDVEVAAFKDTLFTDRNAASRSFACGGDMEALQKVNIAATQRNYVSRDEGEIFFQHQAECMIKTFIPLRYIKNIDNPKKLYK